MTIRQLFRRSVPARAPKITPLFLAPCENCEGWAQVSEMTDELGTALIIECEHCGYYDVTPAENIPIEE